MRDEVSFTRDEATPPGRQAGSVGTVILGSVGVFSVSVSGVWCPCGSYDSGITTSGAYCCYYSYYYYHYFVTTMSDSEGGAVCISSSGGCRYSDGV